MVEALKGKAEVWSKKFEKYLVGEIQSNGEWRGFCPIHEDPETSKSPSASFNFEKAKFICFGKGENGKPCGGMGLKSLEQVIRDDEYEERKAKSSSPKSSVRSIDDAPSKRLKSQQALPDDDMINQWVETLLKSPRALKVMTEKRGLTRETIEKFQIGWAHDRHTIPVRDIDGVLVNVRRYSATASKPQDKMFNLTGHGQARLFLPHVLKDNDEVIITEGEMDAIIGQQAGLPTMSHTAGASVWKAEWSPLFDGKTVFICYDIDDAGYAGANKVATSVGRYAKAVHKIRLPLSAKGSDLTNYLVDNGYTADDFRALMEKSREKNESRKKPDVKAQKASPVGLEKSMDASLSGQALELTVTVAAKVQPVYTMPKTTVLECTMDFGPKCAKCPMEARGGQWTKEFARDDEVILEMVDRSKDQRKAILLREIGIPTTCTRVDLDHTEEYAVEEMIVMPSVDNREETQQTPITRKVYNVGEHNTPTNTVQRITGVSRPSPKDARAVFQSWATESVQTNIDKFEMTKGMVKELRRFNPKAGQAPLEKMREIALDIEANVTRIYGRPELHMAYDAVWHSAMDFSFRGVRLGKGWLELMVMGDTRTGKSEAALRLTEHYEAGVLKSCEGATFAGLVGGAQQHGGEAWMVTWGVIPLNDRRLVVLDEVSGLADKNVFDQMSAIRSSGVAQITKITTSQTSARTRLIWISNPVDGRTIEQMSRGAIDGIQQLIKNPEDLARFDLAMSAASSDVDSSLINAIHPPEVKHVYTKERCSNLVAWVWSRKADDIVWDDGVEEYVLTASTKLGERYVNEPPLIQTENVRVKVARVAVAIAGRLFSASDDGEKLIVRTEHVDAAIDLMDMLYNTESFGYARHSKRVIRERSEAQKNRKAAYKYLRSNDDVLHALRAVNGETFRTRDFGEFGGMDKDAEQLAIRTLLQLRMIRRGSRGSIRMEPALVEVMRKLEDADVG